MQDLKRRTVEVDVEALTHLLLAIKPLKIYHEKHLMLLEAALNNKEDELNTIRLGSVITPKPSRNFLRAGDTAYGEVVAVSLDPFIVASKDGFNTWHKQQPEDFTVTGRVSPEQLVVLKIKHALA